MSDSQAPWSVFVLTVSDRAAAGARDDASGPALRKRLEDLGFHVAGQGVVEDDEVAVVQRLRDLCEVSQPTRAHCVVTTGGTGLAPRDRTPEATRAVAHRLVPGLMELARRRCGEITPFAYLSRGVAAVRNSTLILNVPGHPKAAVETLEAVVDLLPHALKILQRTPADCDITGRGSAWGGEAIS